MQGAIGAVVACDRIWWVQSVAGPRGWRGWEGPGVQGAGGVRVRRESQGAWSMDVTLS